MITGLLRRRHALAISRSRLARGVAWTCCLLAALAIAPAVSFAASDGGFSGTVTDAATGAPISQAVVCVQLPNGWWLGGAAQTDADGNYTVSGLPTGSYLVQFLYGSGTTYLVQFYDGAATDRSATPVSVTAGQITPNINAQLQRLGQITGVVTDAATGQGIADATVSVLGSPGQGGGTTTASDGSYTVSGLPAGNYKVEVTSPAGGVDYATQYYSGQMWADRANAVGVGAGQTAGPVDFQLQRTGQITGTVTDATTGAAFVNARVSVRYASEANIAFSGSAVVGPDGTYTVSGLPPGKYVVQFSPPIGSGRDYLPAWYYGGTYWEQSASLVSVAAGQTTPSINAALPLGGQISGTVTDAATHKGIGAPVMVSAVDAAGHNFVVFTDAAGHYTIRRLPPDPYVVDFYVGGYAAEYYGGVTSAATARSVSVSLASRVTGIDMALTRTLTPSRTTSAAKVPGKPNVGRVTVSRSAARIPLACQGGQVATCRMTITLSVSVARRAGRLVPVTVPKGNGKTATKTVTVGSITVVLSGGQRRSASVTLGTTGKRLLASRRRLSVELDVRQAGTRIGTRSLVFRAA